MSIINNIISNYNGGVDNSTSVGYIYKNKGHIFNNVLDRDVNITNFKLKTIGYNGEFITDTYIYNCNIDNGKYYNSSTSNYGRGIFRHLYTTRNDVTRDGTTPFVKDIDGKVYFVSHCPRVTEEIKYDVVVGGAYITVLNADGEFIKTERVRNSSFNSYTETYVHLEILGIVGDYLFCSCLYPYSRSNNYNTSLCFITINKNTMSTHSIFETEYSYTYAYPTVVKKTKLPSGILEVVLLLDHEVYCKYTVDTTGKIIRTYPSNSSPSVSTNNSCIRSDRTFVNNNNKTYKLTLDTSLNNVFKISEFDTETLETRWFLYDSENSTEFSFVNDITRILTTYFIDENTLIVFSTKWRAYDKEDNTTYYYLVTLNRENNTFCITNYKRLFVRIFLFLPILDTSLFTTKLYGVEIWNTEYKVYEINIDKSTKKVDSRIISRGIGLFGTICLIDSKLYCTTSNKLIALNVATSEETYTVHLEYSKDVLYKPLPDSIVENEVTVKITDSKSNPISCIATLKGGEKILFNNKSNIKKNVLISKEGSTFPIQVLKTGDCINISIDILNITEEE